MVVDIVDDDVVVSWILRCYGSKRRRFGVDVHLFELDIQTMQVRYMGD